jgi:hypothetical protein
MPMATDQVDRLIESLLFEGYALYPYTPGAIKNATPTPFGIVYPPAYAAECPGAFDHARLECAAEPEPEAALTATLRYLVMTGERNEAQERRLQLGPVSIGERASEEFEGGRWTVRSERQADGRARVRCCVHNRWEVSAGLSRRESLRRSLLSTQILVTLSSGRFLSPLDGAGQSVNTYPILVGDFDQSVLGTTIVLPDHPQLAPESRGNLFDATEIEEALLLHVQALSDQEREEIERADPAVREMVARAAAATPEDIMALHGRVTVRDPVTLEPPSPPEGLRDPTLGEPEATVDGVRFTRGGRVILRPGQDADLHARMLDGRLATVERIMVDVEGKVHLGVTIDDDPGQELLRETGRLLYFFAPEVEVIQT